MKAVDVVGIAAGVIVTGALYGQDPTMVLRNKTKSPAQPFDLRVVKLLDGPFRTAMLTNEAYLLSLDPDRLLHMFRVTAGLPSSAQPLGGWESPGGELRGHSLGHYLSACALTYASTGDAELKKRTDIIVATLAQCQAALQKQGATPGFLSAYPEEFFDRVEKCAPVWAPYYTLHKIMAGLLDVHTYCGNQQALDVLTNIAAWVKTRNDKLTLDQQQRMLNTEFGGMNEVLANLYAITGNPDHLRLAKVFDHKFVFDPLARGEDRLDGLHANTQIPKAIGAAREFELTGEQAYHTIATCFWDSVALHRSYCIGGHSDREHFYPMKEFAYHLSPANAECCNTYNMLKLTRHLFAWQPDVTYMDFYERAMYNQILASQDPASGMFMYLVPLKPGHFKSYSTPNSSFWCCVGTGMENHGRYGDAIYFHGDDTLYVNLFVASELDWKELGVTIRQETKFPEQDTTTLTVSCGKPTVFDLMVRYPGWAQDGIEVKVNGEPVAVKAKPGSYVSLKRTWKQGDTVAVRVPMRLHTEALPYSPKIVALMYGPIVLAGELGTEGIDPNALFLEGQLDLQHVPTPSVPVLVCEAARLLDNVKPVKRASLTFRTKGIGVPTDVTLIPFYRLQRQRYTIYWQTYTAAELEQEKKERAAAEQRRKDVEARSIDTVYPGEQQPETDHAMKGERTQAGQFNGKKWRHAGEGGWFSYTMKVVPDKPVVLVCTYWGTDAGGRTFDILVDGTTIATQSLNGSKPGEFFDAEYPVPQELTKGKKSVTVKFQAHEGNTAGGVFGIRMAVVAKAKGRKAKE